VNRAAFLALVDDVRPALHRYCARMLGSLADGEDVVQDTLARAFFELADGDPPHAIRPWLFRIAHNRAVDLLRRYERRMSEPLDDHDVPADATDDAARAEATALAVSRFLELPPAQRSAVVLKDVLGHSLDEIADLTALTLPAVKSALHRGRARLRELSARPARPPQPPPAALVRYATLFAARDWDAIRALLADDVKLDLVGRQARAGRAEVGRYFSNYDRLDDWQLSVGDVDGRPVLLVTSATRGRYFVEVDFDGERVVAIRDFRYVPYILRQHCPT
jgi:RNA polymerase sigma-70 factor (ECF subfamily)